MVRCQGGSAAVPGDLPFRRHATRYFHNEMLADRPAPSLAPFA